MGGFAIGAAAGAEGGPAVAAVTSVAGAVSFGASTAIASGKLVDMAFAMSSSGRGTSAGSGGQAEPSRERTAADIISAEKRGAINRVFPEQFRNSTLDRIRTLAQQGDRAAKTALKLLTDSRFDK